MMEKKSKIVTDNTIQIGRLRKVFKSIGKTLPKPGEKLATNIMKYPGRSSENGAKRYNAAVS